MGLFVKPSEVIKRLRDVRDILTAKAEAAGKTPIDFKVYPGGEMPLILKSAKNSLPMSLFVFNSSNTGQITTTAGNSPMEYVTNIGIAFVYEADDDKMAQADELATQMREFICAATMTWDSDDISGNEPVRLTTDSPSPSQGQSTYVHIFVLEQDTEVSESCFDDLFDTEWGDLEWFERSTTDMNFKTANGDENTIVINTEVSPE